MKKFLNIGYIAIIALVFLAVPILTVRGPHQSVSFYEQRQLAPIPIPSLSTLSDGTFFNGIETFLSDHLAGRDQLLKLDVKLNLSLGKTKVNNLVVNSDKLLDCYGFSRWDVRYLDYQSENKAHEYQALKAKIEEYGGYFCFLGVPLQSTYYASSYPEYMDSRLWHTTAIRTAFEKAMNQEGVPFINMYSYFEEQDFPGEYYYATDHHFTMRGAFTTYALLLDHLQANTSWRFEDNTTAADFEWIQLDNPFLGSANRKLYGLWENEDFAEIASPKHEISFTREDRGILSDPKLFTTPESAADQVTYSIYMGGDYGQTVIKTNRPELPTILLYGDSFTNPIETLLWTQANELHCLDFRYYTDKTLYDYIQEIKPDIVVCVRDETVYLANTGNGTT